MNAELENLIEMALADGEVTEKERAIILRKAEALGEDKDEVEMILDGKIALMMKEQNASQQQSKPESNKEGDIKKCPSCGAPASSFATKCPDCGHEFRNIEANKRISNLYDTIHNLDKNEFIDKEMGDDWVDEDAYAERIASIIAGWPIPNTKEDLLEFLSQAVPEANKKIGFWDRVDTAAPKYKRAWKAVCEKIIIKARFSMKEDKKTLEEIEQYAKQLKIK
jgi:hypothetical protein